MRIPGVHRPRSDTWLLADVLRRELAGKRSVADLCTGSGALAVVAARDGVSDVLAVDISRRAAIATRMNARLNSCSLRVRRGDLIEMLGQRRFDVIVCNPPYVPAPTDELPRHRATTALDAGRDGRAVLDRVCRDVPRHLRAGGCLLLVQSSVCGVEQTCELLRRGGLNAQVLVRARGPLGPVLGKRAPMLRARGLLGDRDEEELVVIRACAPTQGGEQASND